MVSAARGGPYLHTHPKTPKSKESEMPCSEGMAAAGFEIELKGLGFYESLKCEIGLDFPWHEFGSMRNLAGIMFCEAGA